VVLEVVVMELVTGGTAGMELTQVVVAVASSEVTHVRGAGGSGVVILRLPTADYSGTTTGSPTVTTDGSDTILVFNSSGSYTG
jgi:hypothetical protein